VLIDFGQLMRRLPQPFGRRLIASDQGIIQICYLHRLHKEFFEMRSLNLDQLRALQAVADGKSFSVAARRLNLSQPAVSLQIRELERRFGVKLIDRLGKQTHVTPPGRELLVLSERILQECDHAELAMRRFRQGWIGRVRIATTNTALTFLLPPVLRKLSSEHPGIDLHITNLPTRESVEAIIQNRIDLALVSLPVETTQLVVTPLISERMMAIFPADARNVPDEVTPAFVMSQPLLLEHTRAALYDLVMLWLSSQRGQPRVPMHLGTIEAMKSAVASNLGMSIIPEIAVNGREEEIVVRPLNPPLSRTLALIEHRSKRNEPALEIARAAILALRKPARKGSAQASKRPRRRKPAGT
jgi:DNA-binding transcriptional LysR family regulator